VSGVYRIGEMSRFVQSFVEILQSLSAIVSLALSLRCLLLQHLSVALDPRNCAALSQLQFKLKFGGAVPVVDSHALLACDGPAELKRSGYVNLSPALSATQRQMLQLGN
jgi:hypothetical protein